MYPNSAMLANTDLVYTPHVFHHGLPCASALQGLSGTTGSPLLYSSPPVSPADGLSLYRESFEVQGVPAEAVSFILGSWSGAIQKQYCTAFTKWGNYCLLRKISQFHPALAEVLDFLVAHLSVDSLKNLTLKVTMLMALIRGLRPYALKLSDMCCQTHESLFTGSKLH